MIKVQNNCVSISTHVGYVRVHLYALVHYVRKDIFRQIFPGLHVMHCAPR